MSRTVVLLILGAVLTGCGQDPVTSPPDAPPGNQAATTIVIDGAPGLMVPGSEADLTATVLAQDGRALSGVPVQWSSDRPDIASVSTSGVVRAGNIEGPVRIRASSGGALGSTETFVSKTTVPGRLAMGQVTGPYTQTIWLVPLDGMPRTEVATVHSYAHFVGGPNWSRDGSRLLFVCTQPERALCTLSVSGELAIVPHTRGLPHPYFSAVWSPGDSEIVFTGKRVDGCYGGDCLGAWAIRPDGTGLHPITIPGTDVFMSAGGLQYSPDGRRASFNLFESIYDYPSLCIQPVPFGDYPQGCLEVASTSSWSPDGSRLALDAGYSLVVRTADGSAPDVVVFSGSYPDDLVLSPTWSPDGQWLAFQRMSAGKEGTGSIWLVRPDGSNLVRMTGQGWVGPSWGR